MLSLDKTCKEEPSIKGQQDYFLTLISIFSLTVLLNPRIHTQLYFQTLACICRCLRELYLLQTRFVGCIYYTLYFTTWLSCLPAIDRKQNASNCQCNEPHAWHIHIASLPVATEVCFLSTSSLLIFTLISLGL